MNGKPNGGSVETYAQYLRKRKKVRTLVYRWFIYPRLDRCLHGNILDVGCGIGDFLAFRSDTEGIDVDPANVRYCRQRGLPARLIRDGVYPYDEATFDGAIMDNVLEHIAQPSPALNELRRVLKPGATVIVGVPGQRGYRHDPDHKQFYDRKRLTETMQAHGFVSDRFIYTPLGRSAWLNRHLRQYCIYGIFHDGRQP